jgi:transaldolase
MKIFIDTANIEQIKRYAFIVDGVTTNPTLISMERKNFKFKELINTITEIVDGPISVEAVSQQADELVKEARELAALSENVVVKIPMTEEGVRATNKLSSLGVKTNVTLVFSVNQALLAAKAGATYVSPFIGRLDDIGHDGLDVVKDIVNMFETYNLGTQVITASIRHPLHVVNAVKTGTHIATIPPKVLALMFKHNLTDAGLKRFLEDWKLVSS